MTLCCCSVSRAETDAKVPVRSKSRLPISLPSRFLRPSTNVEPQEEVLLSERPQPGKPTLDGVVKVEGTERSDATIKALGNENPAEPQATNAKPSSAERKQAPPQDRSSVMRPPDPDTERIIIPPALLKPWIGRRERGEDFSKNSDGFRELLHAVNFRAEDREQAYEMIEEAGFSKKDFLTQSHLSISRLEPVRMAELSADIGFVPGRYARVWQIKGRAAARVPHEVRGKIGIIIAWVKEASFHGFQVKMSTGSSYYFGVECLEVVDVETDFFTTRRREHRDLGKEEQTQVNTFLRNHRRKQAGPFKDKPNEEIRDVSNQMQLFMAQHQQTTSHGTAVLTLQRPPKVGEVVTRGPAWQWQDTNGGPQSPGSIWSVDKEGYYCSVYWHETNLLQRHYQFDGRYDLRLAPPEVGKRGSYLPVAAALAAANAGTPLPVPGRSSRSSGRNSVGAAATAGSMVRRASLQGAIALGTVMGRKSAGSAAPTAPTPASPRNSASPPTDAAAAPPRGSMVRRASLQGASALAGIANFMSGGGGEGGGEGGAVSADGEARVMSYNAGFCTPQETVFIFEFDDLLFPTTFVRDDRKLSLDMPPLQQKAVLQRKLMTQGFDGAEASLDLGARIQETVDFVAKTGYQTEKLLRFATLLGKVILVTLLKPKVFAGCSTAYCPKFSKLVKELGIRIIYIADAKVGTKAIRARAAKDAANSGGSPKRSTLVLGDAAVEESSGLKPTDAEWLELACCEAKGKLIAAELHSLFKKSKFPCRNLISICDCDFERRATFTALVEEAEKRKLFGEDAPAIFRTFAEDLEASRIEYEDYGGRVLDMRSKVVKAIDQPLGQESLAQLKMLRHWLAHLTFLDEDCDIDLDACTHFGHVQEIDTFLQEPSPMSASFAYPVFGLAHPREGRRLLPRLKAGTAVGKKPKRGMTNTELDDVPKASPRAEDRPAATAMQDDKGDGGDASPAASPRSRSSKKRVTSNKLQKSKSVVEQDQDNWDEPGSPGSPIDRNSSKKKSLMKRAQSRTKQLQE